jgi:hypothetical protein
MRSKADLYRELAGQLSSLLAGERDLIANAANFSSLVFQTLPDLNWAGFYFAKDGELVLGRSRESPLVCASSWVREFAAPERRSAKRSSSQCARIPRNIAATALQIPRSWYRC